MKTCASCEHYRHRRQECGHPSGIHTETDPISGYVEITYPWVKIMRGIERPSRGWLTGEMAYSPKQICGLDGKLWEPKKRRLAGNFTSFFSRVFSKVFRSVPGLRRVKLLSKMINKKEE